MVHRDRGPAQISDFLRFFSRLVLCQPLHEYKGNARLDDCTWKRALILSSHRETMAGEKLVKACFDACSRRE